MSSLPLRLELFLCNEFLVDKIQNRKRSSVGAFYNKSQVKGIRKGKIYGNKKI